MHFSKIADQTYIVSEGDISVEVAYSWLRNGGWQWVVQDRRIDQQWVTGTTRKDAAEKALRKIGVK